MYCARANGPVGNTTRSPLLPRELALPPTAPLLSQWTTTDSGARDVGGPLYVPHVAHCDSAPRARAAKAPHQRASSGSLLLAPVVGASSRQTSSVILAV